MEIILLTLEYYENNNFKATSFQKDQPNNSSSDQKKSIQASMNDLRIYKYGLPKNMFMVTTLIIC